MSSVLHIIINALLRADWERKREWKRLINCLLNSRILWTRTVCAPNSWKSNVSVFLCLHVSYNANWIVYDGYLSHVFLSYRISINTELIVPGITQIVFQKNWTKELIESKQIFLMDFWCFQTEFTEFFAWHDANKKIERIDLSTCCFFVKLEQMTR